MNENVTNNWTEVLCLMLETMDFSLDLQEDGNYCLIDEQGAYLGGIETYRDFEEDCAWAIIDRLTTYLNDYYYEDLEEEAENYGIDASADNDEELYEAKKWVRIMDENEHFKLLHFHEYEVMKLISSPDIYNSIKLADVVRYFNPDAFKQEDRKIVIGRPIEGVSLNGLEYLLDDDGDVLKFDSIIDAKVYLFDRGYTEQEIEDEGIIIKKESLLDAVYGTSLGGLEDE